MIEGINTPNAGAGKARGRRFGWKALLGVAILCAVIFAASLAVRPAREAAAPPPAAIRADEPAQQAVIPAAVFDPNTVVPADRFGLLDGGGDGVSFEKVALDRDWRDAAIIKAGGFLAAATTVTQGSELSFAAGARPGGRTAGLVVTAVCDGTNIPLWRADRGTLGEGRWTAVRVPLAFAGQAKFVFESDGGADDTAAIVANPRIEAAQAPGADRPNVILVIVDALRADRLGIYGYGRTTSPEIDALAQRGVIFDECYAQAPWTLPSVGTIFTGVYPTVHGMTANDRALGPEFDTLAQRFSQAGYSTCSLQGNPLVAPQLGPAKGFGRWVEFEVAAPRYGAKLSAPASEVNAAALDWIDSTKGRPFFLYIQLMDVHEPYEPPQEFRRFGSEKQDLYDAGVAYATSEFGSFFGALEKRGLLANTVVVLTSDHGEQLGEHGAWGHGYSLHCEELRVPLVFWAPDAKAGRRVASMVSLVDLPPTLLGLAGLDALPETIGRSLAGALRGDGLPPAPSFAELETPLFARGEPSVSVTSGQWRLLVYNPGGTLDSGSAERAELFDARSDAYEKRDLASERADVTGQLKATLAAFVEEQRRLHARLVPSETVVPLTEERKRQLEALGYISPSHDAGGAK